MHCDAEPLSELIGHIYDAALDSELWPSFLQSLSDAIGGSSALFFQQDLTRRRVGFMVACRIDPSALESYGAYYAPRDVWVDAAVRVPAGTIVDSATLVPPEEFARSEFYNDFLTRLDIFHVVSAVVANRRAAASWCAVFRPERAGDFGRDEHELMGLLYPHLRRGLELHARRRCEEAERHGALDALASLGQGAILVDRAGTVVWANPAAEDLLSAQDGLATCSGRLVCASRGTTAELRALIAGAADALAKPGLAPGGVMAVPRTSLARRYHVTVTPLPGARAMAESMPGLRDLPVAAVFVTDPENQPTPPAHTLARLHGLTNAEAKLAAAFAAGTSLKDYAEEADFSLNYVRWLLKQIQAKTDTHTQTELMRALLSQIAPPATNQ